MDCRQFKTDSRNLTCTWTASPRSNSYDVTLMGSDGYVFGRKEVYYEFADLSELNLAFEARYYVKVGLAVHSIFLTGSSTFLLFNLVKSM